MRLWLKDSERRPDPAPATTDDRKVMLVGTILWVLALGVMLIVLLPRLDDSNVWMLWTAVIGIVLGIAGLIYTQRRHTR